MDSPVVAWLFAQIEYLQIEEYKIFRATSFQLPNIAGSWRRDGTPLNNAAHSVSGHT